MVVAIKLGSELREESRVKPTECPTLKKVVEAPTFIELYLRDNNTQIISNGTISNAHVPASTPLEDTFLQVLAQQESIAKNRAHTEFPRTEDLDQKEIEELIYKNERKARKRLLKAALTFFIILGLLIGTMTIVSLTMFSKEVITPAPTPKPVRVEHTPKKVNPQTPQPQNPVPENTHNDNVKPEENQNPEETPDNSPDPNQNQDPKPNPEHSTPPKSDNPKPETDKLEHNSGDPNKQENSPKPDKPNNPSDTGNPSKPQHGNSQQ